MGALSIAAPDDGTLALVGPDGVLLSGLALRLRAGDRVVTGPLVATDAPAGRGHDGAGEYQATRWRLAADGVRAELELRRYASPPVVVGMLHLGQAPASLQVVELALSPESFARGVALKRVDPSWLAPAFVSDARLLSPANRLLLWQRVGSADHHALAPLACDGLAGEVGQEGYRMRVALTLQSGATWPRAVPLFACAIGRDPYRLVTDLLRAGLAASGAPGRTRDEKPLPEVFRWLGWCAGKLGEDKVLASALSLAQRRIPVGFMLIDGDLAGLARALRGDFGVRHLGAWQHPAAGADADADGEVDAQRRLRAAGYDFLKADDRPHVQEAATGAGLELLVAGGISLGGALRWRSTAVARNSEDYVAGDRRATRAHILHNAYNALWTSSFAWPDWDMFQTSDRDALVHAIARALSGGPIYFTDDPGSEQADLLRALCDRSGRLYQLDQPGMVTRDLLLADPSMGAGALKVWGRVRRPGYEAGAVGAFHVDKAAELVRGQLRSADVEGFPTGARAAVWRHVAQAAAALEPTDALAFVIEEPGAELFTLVPIDDGIAVLGLLDKLLGPAAVTAVGRPDGDLEVRLSEGGELGLWLERPVSTVEIDGDTVAPEHVRQDGALVRIAAAAFGDAFGDRRVTVLFD